MNKFFCSFMLALALSFSLCLFGFKASADTASVSTHNDVNFHFLNVDFLDESKLRSDFPSYDWDYLLPYMRTNFDTNVDSSGNRDFFMVLIPSSDHFNIVYYRFNNSPTSAIVGSDGSLVYPRYATLVEFYPNKQSYRWIYDYSVNLGNTDVLDNSRLFTGSFFSTLGNFDSLYYYSGFGSLEFSGASALVSFSSPFVGDFSLDEKNNRLNFTFNLADSADFQNLVNGVIFTFVDENGDIVFQPSSYLSYVPNLGKHISGSELQYVYLDGHDNSYSFDLRSLKSGGLKVGETYTVKANCHGPGVGTLFNFASFTFQLTSSGLQVPLNVTLGSGISAFVTGANSYINENGDIINADTGQTVSASDISYSFSYDKPTLDDGVYDGDTKFPSAPAFFSQLISGAGFVRTCFDRLINIMGLDSFMLSLISIAIASWFVFGHRL